MRKGRTLYRDRNDWPTQVGDPVLVVRKVDGDPRTVSISPGTLVGFGGTGHGEGDREIREEAFEGKRAIAYDECHVQYSGSQDADFFVAVTSALVRELTNHYGRTVVWALDGPGEGSVHELTARHEQLKRDLRGERRRRKESERSYQRILSALINREHLDALVAALRGEETTQSAPTEDAQDLDHIVGEVGAIRQKVADIDRWNDARDRGAVGTGLNDVYGRLGAIICDLQRLREQSHARSGAKEERPASDARELEVRALRAALVIAHGRVAELTMAIFRCDAFRQVDYSLAQKLLHMCSEVTAKLDEAMRLAGSLS